MRDADFALDHAGFAARRVDGLCRQLRDAGFAPTVPQALLGRDATGQAVDLGQRSAHCVFRQTYLEITATCAAANHLQPFLSRYEGLHILALRAAEIDRVRARLVTAGFAPSPVQVATRHIAYGERHGEARFRWFMLPAIVMPEALVCIVENLSPELIYQAAAGQHPNGTTDLRAVQGVVADLNEASGRYELLLGQAPARAAGTARFALANGVLELFSAEALAECFPGFVPPAEPALVGLRFGSAGALPTTIQLPAPAHAVLTWEAAP